jgi:hypothetical protein
MEDWNTDGYAKRVAEADRRAARGSHCLVVCRTDYPGREGEQVYMMVPKSQTDRSRWSPGTVLMYDTETGYKRLPHRELLAR